LCTQTLEKISEEFPSSIVREGGLAALLNYLDFFSIAVQRTALQAASNCCRNVSVEHFPMIRAVWPIIRNCLSYSDQRLVEFACLCVIRVIDSYYRASTENLELLVDTDLIKAVNMLLLPAGGSPLIAANTYTLLLRSLATSARASPKITLALLEADIVDTLYQILTGVLPSLEISEEQGNASRGQGLGGGLADMTVMDNLAHRPKDQVEEALSLISELMPPLPKGAHISADLDLMLTEPSDGVFDHKAYTEKSLARLVKARAKAERAATRHGAASSYATTPGSMSAQNVTTQDPAACETGLTDSQTQDTEEPFPNVSVQEPISGRTELLRSKPVVVGRFMQLMIPILIDVYAASVITPVRVKTLTGLLKAVSFLDGEGLKGVLTVRPDLQRNGLLPDHRALQSVPVASFASSILSSKDHPSLVIGALQLVDLLLTKVPTEYKPTFRREGVFHEIETLASRELASAKLKDKDKDGSEAPSPSDAAALLISAPVLSSATIPGFKKLSSLSLEPEDAITLRCRVIRFKHLTGHEHSEGDSAFEDLRQLVERLSVPDASERELSDTLKALAELFGSPHTAVSSFELMQSGVVDGLLQFAVDPKRCGKKLFRITVACTQYDVLVSVKKREEIIFDAFSPRRSKSLISHSPLATLVKKLQESLTRMESFDVVTVAQGGDGQSAAFLMPKNATRIVIFADSKRSSPSLLARQLRLRLVAGDDSDIPRNLHNIVVSIHAIATFQALHDYLRPRVAGLLSNTRLSGMLAALTPSSLATGTSSRNVPEETPQTQSAKNSTAENNTSLAVSTGTAGRRRSLRLSAKQAGGTVNDEKMIASTGDAEPDDSTVPGASASELPMPDIAGFTPSIEAAPSDTVVDSELQADFTDDEVEAEVASFTFQLYFTYSRIC
jgi:E3 ubiquitin-protein ligase TRIP12